MHFTTHGWHNVWMAQCKIPFTICFFVCFFYFCKSVEGGLFCTRGADHLLDFPHLNQLKPSPVAFWVMKCLDVNTEMSRVKRLVQQRTCNSNSMQCFPSLRSAVDNMKQIWASNFKTGDCRTRTNLISFQLINLERMIKCLQGLHQNERLYIREYWEVHQTIKASTLICLEASDGLKTNRWAISRFLISCKLAAYDAFQSISLGIKTSTVHIVPDHGSAVTQQWHICVCLCVCGRFIVHLLH